MKKMALFSVALLVAAVSFSQTFMHGAGFSSYGLIFKNTSGDYDADVYGGFSYSARFTVMEGENTSLSVGIPLNIGIGGSYSYNSSSYYGSSTSNSLTYMINAPLMLDFNFGAGAHKETEKRFGFFIGAGAGLHQGTVYTEYYDSNAGYYYDIKQNISTFGIASNLGFRIAVGRNQKNIETRISFMKGLNDFKPAIFSLGAAFNF
jgi:hypothetical protein